MAQSADFTPKAMPNRDDNSPVVDMNFNGLSAAMKALAATVRGLSAAAVSAGNFIWINLSQSAPQPAAYNIDQYGMAAQGHMHCMTISKDLTIPANWCNQMINPVVETGTLVTVEAGGLWFVDT